MAAPASNSMAVRPISSAVAEVKKGHQPAGDRQWRHHERRSSSKAALEQSGADAVMIGRGAYGRPWIAAAVDAALDRQAMSEPDVPPSGHRLNIFTDTLRFHGDALGLKIFRKHLGWYVERALCPADLTERRAVQGPLVSN